MYNNKIGYKLILFLINPFISAIESLINIRERSSYITLYMWFMIFGISFCAVNEAADSFRYVKEFMIEKDYTIYQYTDKINEYLTFETNIKDIYTLTINFLVGRFTDNYHWTYFIYSIIFGLFYIKSLKIFIQYNRTTNNYVFYALLFMFCFSNPIFNINGVRFWTAAWIGVYVALSVFVKKDYKKIPLLILMPLIHGSTVIWIVIMVIALLMSRFQNVTIISYILSIFVSATSYLNILNDYSYILPQFMQNQIWSYTESEWALERLSGEYGVAYANFLNALPGYFQILMSMLLIFNRKKIKEKYASRLLTIVLALAAITNFLSGIPSLGRFQNFIIPLLVVTWAYNYNILIKYNKLFYLIPIVYAYTILYWCRNMYSVTELYMYTFPAPLTVIKYLFL